MNDQDQKHQEIIDIEEHAREGREIPHAEKYRIRIDKQQYVVSVPEMTGEQLLTIAQNLPPERYALYQKLRGGETVKIEQSQIVNFRTPGVERFMTLPLDQTEGAEPAENLIELRRHYNLPEDDVSFLDRLGLPWETVTENNVQRVVVYG